MQSFFHVVKRLFTRVGIAIIGNKRERTQYYLTERVNWVLFQKQYKNASEQQKVNMIKVQLPHFATRPDWVSLEVWGKALKRLNQKRAA